MYIHIRCLTTSKTPEAGHLSAWDRGSACRDVLRKPKTESSLLAGWALRAEYGRGCEFRMPRGYLAVVDGFDGVDGVYMGYVCVSSPLCAATGHWYAVFAFARCGSFARGFVLFVCLESCRWSCQLVSSPSSTPGVSERSHRSGLVGD